MSLRMCTHMRVHGHSTRPSPSSRASLAGSRAPSGFGTRSGLPRRSSVIRAEEKSSGESGKAEASEAEMSEPGAPPKGNAYIDELPEVKKQEMSKEMKDRMRAEYLGLGGAENKPMGANYFLWIIVVISALAVASSLTGAI